MCFPEDAKRRMLRPLLVLFLAFSEPRVLQGQLPNDNFCILCARRLAQSSRREYANCSNRLFCLLCLVCMAVNAWWLSSYGRLSGEPCLINAVSLGAVGTMKRRRRKCLCLSSLRMKNCEKYGCG
uniref:Secreted protein n=1 Tax=Ixodes ricinus TaxID=34613 RepID=A0A6B0UQM9_IXORI